MLNKKILKSILNVKHTARDDMKILPDGTIAIKAHPTKGEQCRCGICGRKSVRYDNGRGGTRSWRTSFPSKHLKFFICNNERYIFLNYPFFCYPITPYLRFIVLQHLQYFPVSCLF